MRESEASWQVSARLRAIHSLLLAKAVEEKLRKLERAVKANFNPNQPRVPRGNPDAVCKMADKVFLGVNSAAQKYSFRDLQEAERLRRTLIEKHPLVMSTDNISQFPNDALFHSEMTCLMRAARANGGTLRDQTVEMTVDRDMCESCKRILPLIGLELGNPTVKFVDPRGSIRVMRDGSWIEIESP
jgi:hypothetical protein